MDGDTYRYPPPAKRRAAATADRRLGDQVMTGSDWPPRGCDRAELDRSPVPATPLVDNCGPIGRPLCDPEARPLTLGFEGLDYEGGEDLELGRARQAVLVARDERIAVDGRVGPESLAAARR
jgi:hypothetical protein